MTKFFRLIVLVGLLLVLPAYAWSIPTQYGDTGLLSQPTANTLNAGNICVGLWANVSDDSVQTSTVMPFAITLGLGSFLEFYASYPNLLFNDDETTSGRGYVNLGTKIRILGKRSSLVKLAIDAQIQRHISNDPVFDGLNDYQGRAIVSIANAKFGVHAYGSYRMNDEPTGFTFEDQVGFGGGIEFFPTERLRLIIEAESYTEKISGTEGMGEVTAGFQYFISPHLTFSVGVGYGLTDQSPDFRVLTGFSTCQGIGSYNSGNRLEELEELEVIEEQKTEPVKVLKLKTLSPLIPISTAADAPATSSVDAIPSDAPESVTVSPLAVATPLVAVPDSTPTPVDVPEPTVAPVVPLVVAAATIPTAAELEVVVPEDAPVVLVEPAESIMAPGTIPEPSVNFPDSPTQLAVASTATPVIAAATPTQLYRKFVLPEFTFKFGKYNISDEGRVILAEIAEELSADGKWFIVRLDGHTDSTGPDQYNDKLSLQRAIEYAVYLIEQEAVDARRVFVKGFGKFSPLASNTTPEGRTLNRRVEVLLLVRSESGG